MLTYAQAVSTQNDQLFLKCGTKAVAGRLASEKSAGSGPDFTVVLHSSLRIIQPYHLTGSNANNTQFIHEVELLVPNYQPIQSMALNFMNQKLTLDTLTLNCVAVVPNGSRRELIGQYLFTNGFISDYQAQPGMGDGSLLLTFVFEKIAHNDLLTHTSGDLSTTAIG